MPRQTILADIAHPGWMPSVRAVIILAIVQAGRPLSIEELLTECRAHVPNYQPGQCSQAIRSLEADFSIMLTGGRYDIFLG